MKQFAVRYHDFSYGHRVVNHESKCKQLHGHNGRVTFYCSAPSLDKIGRVMDFSDIKTRLCEWVEENWDHKTIIWSKDPWANALSAIDPTIVFVEFNPTAENLAAYLLRQIGPLQLAGTPVVLDRVVFEETRKCSVLLERDEADSKTDWGV